MDQEYEKRLTTVEVNMVHVSANLKELSELTKSCMSTVANLISKNVEDTDKKHDTMLQQIQKNKDFVNRIIWSVGGGVFVITAILGIYKLF